MTDECEFCGGEHDHEPRECEMCGEEDPAIGVHTIYYCVACSRAVKKAQEERARCPQCDVGTRASRSTTEPRCHNPDCRVVTFKVRSVDIIARARAIRGMENEEEREVDEDILDATCGGRSIWCEGQKEREDTLYIDIRKEREGYIDSEAFGNRTYAIRPDEMQDFRDLPYADKQFNLIVFDPPHVTTENGMEKLSGINNKKYGSLRAESWQKDLKAGFKELWRVLKPGGIIAFKFADRSIPFREVLNEIPYEPLFGTRTAKTERSETKWFVFYKDERYG